MSDWYANDISINFWGFFVYNIVTGFAVSEYFQMYEVLGWPLSDPIAIACETHKGISRKTD